MDFQLEEAIEILSRTPSVLKTLLLGLSSSWVMNSEGPETWSPYDVVGHLIHADKTNWMARAKVILEGDAQPFAPFDRFEMSKGKSIDALLEEFALLREHNLVTLREAKLNEQDFEKTGMHPEFGEVKLRELLATWVVHDLSHIRQIVRTMAKQYEIEVGPWKAYLSIFQK